MQDRRGPKLEWAVVHTIENEEAKLAVEISRADDQYGSKQYSLRVGKIIERNGEQVFMSHMRLFKDRHSFDKVRLSNPIVENITRLLTAAEEWVTTDMVQYHEAEMDMRRNREEAEASYGRKDTRRTGKTARRRERHRDQEI